MKRRCDFPRGLLPLWLVVTMLNACSLAPTYQVPVTPVSPQYQESSAADQGWVEARPADRLARDGWWKLYGDATLDALQQRLLANNTELAAALAHYQQAQAFSAEARAGLFPQLSAAGNVQRDRESENKPLRAATAPADYNSFTLGAELDYEIDLWGKVRNTVEAGKDDAQAATADLASIQLSLQAELADNYVQLRGLDQQIALLQQTTAAYEKALQLTQTLQHGGIASGLDVARAQTQLLSARSMWSQTKAQRALCEHVIAVLVGEPASQFTLVPQATPIALPVIPVSVPSTLLQRRPDVAAAERRTAAANARIGIARAAYFPDLSLSALAGFQSTAYDGWLTAPNRFWAIGPTALLTVFDGGRRKAQVTAARAATDEAGATYRGVVLAAFQQVEDSLAQLDDYGTARIDQKGAATAAMHSLDLAMERYRHGAVGYLDVVQAQTASLDAQRSLLDLDTKRLQASVQLVRALGGGWERGDLNAPTSAIAQVGRLP